LHTDCFNVNFMQRVKKGNKFLWPRRRDVLDDVLCVVPEAPETENNNFFVCSRVADIDALFCGR